MTAQQLHGVIRRILGSTTWFGRPVWQWILVTGLIVRVAYLAAAWTCSPVERWWICSDTSGFTAAAESLMNGTYSCRPGDDRFRYNRPPGYPAVLALTSMLTGTQPESTSILFVQAVMGALWCAMMYDLTRRLNLRNEIATIVGLAAVFHPTSVSAGALSLSDASALFFVTAGLWFLATGKQKTSFYLLIAGSLCIGFAVITRSAYQAFILACPLVIWLWPEGKRPGYALLTASFSGGGRAAGSVDDVYVQPGRVCCSEHQQQHDTGIPIWAPGFASVENLEVTPCWLIRRWPGETVS